MIDTQPQSVLPHPEQTLAADNLRTPWWSIVLATVAVQIIIAVLVASMWPANRIEHAPGSAQEVGPRILISGATVYEPSESPYFVTAVSSELTGLQALMGWYDDTVDVRTCEQEFGGPCDRETARQVALGAMVTAKQLAEYVASRRVGLDAALVAGPAQVGSFSDDTCPDDAPARRACRQLEIGDTITEVDGTAIEVLDDLTGVLDDRRPGDTIAITVQRQDGSDVATLTVDVELMAAPDDDTRTIIGFVPRDTRTAEVPIDVQIATDDIGGPSAGLSFTLSLIDLLSEGDLTGDERVVVTGTIDETGAVGAIGSLPQKAEAVRRAGATLFIVPSGQRADEVARAQAIAGDDVEIVQVATLEEALEALAERGGDPIPPAPEPAG